MVSERNKACQHTDKLTGYSVFGSVSISSTMRSTVNKWIEESEMVYREKCRNIEGVFVFL